MVVNRKLVIEELELRDFLSHRDTIISFGTGIHVFSGENGAGKSSIVDALYYLLSQPNTLRGNRKSDLVRRGSSRAMLKGRFRDLVTGDVVEVKSVIGDQAEALLWINGRLVASGVREVRRRLEKDLYQQGLEPEKLLGNTSIIRQGGLSRIISVLSGGAQSERLRYFQRLLGLKEYKDAAEKLKEYSITVTVGQFSVGPFYPTERSIRSLNSEVEKGRRELARLSSEVTEKRRQLEEAGERIRELEDRMHRLEDMRRELEESIKRLGSLESLVSTLESSIEELAARIREIRRERTEIEAEISKTRLPGDLWEFRKNKLEKYMQLRNEHARTQVEIEGRKRIVEELWEAVRAKSSAEEYERLRSALDEARREITRLREEKAGLEQLLKAASEWESRVGSFLQSLAGKGLRASSLEEALEELEGKLVKKRMEMDMLRRDRENVSRMIGELEASLKDAREKLDLLEKSESGRCPLCGHELSEEERSRLVKMLKERMEKAAGDISRAEERLREVSSILRRLEEEIKSLEELSNRGRVLLSQKPVDDVESLRSQIESIRERITRLEERIRSLEAEKNSIEGEWQVYNAVKQRYRVEPEEALRSVSAELDSLKAKSESLAGEISRLETEIRSYAVKWGLPPDPGMLYKQVDRLIEQFKHVLQLKPRLQALVEEEERLSEKKTRLEEEYQRIKGEIDRLKPLRREYDRIVGEVNRVRRELNKSYMDRGRLEGELKALEEKRRDLSSLVAKLVEARSRLRLLYRAREILEELPTRILSETMSRLEEEMTRIIQEFDLSYTGVSIDPETLEFRLVDPGGGEVSLSQLSGGEQTSVALAYVVGLNKVLGGVAGFLVLDEPTTHLDPGRRKALVSVLRRALEPSTGLSQLVIVTHHEEVKDAADVLCNVSNRNGVSIVECEGL